MATETGVKAVKDTLGEGQSAAQFMAEWKRLSDQDKADLRAGCNDGTLTY